MGRPIYSCYSCVFLSINYKSTPMLAVFVFQCWAGRFCKKNPEHFLTNNANLFLATPTTLVALFHPAIIQAQQRKTKINATTSSTRGRRAGIAAQQNPVASTAIAHATTSANRCQFIGTPGYRLCAKLRKPQNDGRRGLMNTPPILSPYYSPHSGAINIK